MEGRRASNHCVLVLAVVISKYRCAAIIVLNQNSLTFKEIAAKNIAPERTGSFRCNILCIIKIIKNFKVRGSISEKKASGCPRVSSKQDFLILKSQLQLHVTTRAELAQYWPHRCDASAHTVRWRPRQLTGVKKGSNGYSIFLWN